MRRRSCRTPTGGASSRLAASGASASGASALGALVSGAAALGVSTLGIATVGTVTARAQAAGDRPARAPAGLACAAEDATARATRTPVAATRWPAPLDRVVTLDARDVPLAEALDRLQAASRVRLTYTLEALPAGRRACLTDVRAPVGDLLARLLRGADVAPVVAGPDHVVLAPAQPVVVGDSAPAFARRTGVLERVVVTGSAMGGALGAPERALPVAVSVVPGRALGGALGDAGGTTMAAALAGHVPGVWAWAQAPTSLVAAYGSIRGASSFGVTSPKVYVDGIEVANPLLLARLDPASVERLEVIRGPQGAALYGADAISGVVNVVTRRDGSGGGEPGVRLTSRAGAARSDFASAGGLAAGGVLAQEHALALRAGRGVRTASLGATLGTLGAYVPGAASRTLLVTGAGRVVGRRSILTGTLRYGDDAVGAASNPLLARVPASGPARALLAGDSTARQSLRQYTLGGSATFAPAGRWTHAFVAGLDGYRLTGAATGALPLLSPSDSALRAAEGETDRVTLRASSVARYGAPEALAGSLTLTLDHSTARDATRGAPRATTWASGAVGGAPNGSPVVPPGGALGGALGGAIVNALVAAGDAQVEWWNTTGVVSQGTLAWRDAVALTAGLRVERNAGSLGTAQYALLPLVGASATRELGAPLGAAAGPLTVKLRAAYGEGIRPARTLTRSASWIGRLPPGPGGVLAVRAAPLDPETQAGVEAGIDLYLGRVAALHVTRFDQRASGLIQPVAVVAAESDRGGPGTPGGPRAAAGRLGYVLQNVGAIDNRGWEVEASFRARDARLGGVSLGTFTLGGALSLVASEVRRIAPGYTGELRAGDRMLGVPARTVAASLGWTRGRAGASVGASRAFDWVGYDRVALGGALARAADEVASGPGGPGGGGGGPGSGRGDGRSVREPRDFVGAPLRAYWRTYPGITRLRAEGTWRLTRGVAVTAVGENLLDRQVGEPDNGTVLPGRVVTVGVRMETR